MSIASIHFKTTKDRKKAKEEPEKGCKLSVNATSFIPMAIPMDAKTLIKSSLLKDYALPNYPTVASYVNQAPFPETYSLIQLLISSLHMYEQRVIAGKKGKRRLVRGMKETLKQLQKGRVRLLIIASDINTDNVGNELWNLIVEAQKQSIPIVFGTTSKELSDAFGNGSWISTSALGVINPDGAYQTYQQLTAIAIKAHNKWLALAKGIACEELYADRSTILLSMAEAGHAKVLKAISQESAFRKYINAPCPRTGSTALALAASIGQYEVVKVLLESGADILQKNFSLQTALHLAARSGKVECFEIISEAIRFEGDCQKIIILHDASTLDCLDYAVLSKSPLMVAYVIKLYAQDTHKAIKELFKQEAPNPKILSLLLTKYENPSDTDLSDLILNLAKIDSLNCLRILISWIKVELRKDDKALQQIIDSPAQLDKGTATWWAAYLGHVGIARELLLNGADSTFTFEMNNQLFSIGSLLEKCKQAARGRL